jgi:UDP-N-acetylglucosamine 2-epimerase (non-hydrolysing)
MVSAPLFKGGYRIGHIEGGMRSYDRRMPEEVNRVICDYVSDYIFVYTPLYKERLVKENKNPEQVFVVGNTIREIVREFRPQGQPTRDFIVADIHRSENLKSVSQYTHILNYLNSVGQASGMPVKLVKFNRALKLVGGESYYRNYPHIELIGPYGFLKYLNLQYNAYGVISDSGTSQEECPLLGVPVAVPRKATERPESVENGNSLMVGEERPVATMTAETLEFFRNYSVSDKQLEWLGDGHTAARIVNILKEVL